MYVVTFLVSFATTLVAVEDVRREESLSPQKKTNRARASVMATLRSCAGVQEGETIDYVMHGCWARMVI